MLTLLVIVCVLPEIKESKDWPMFYLWPLVCLLSCFSGLAADPQCIARGFCVSQTYQCNRCHHSILSTPQRHCRKVGACSLFNPRSETCPIFPSVVFHQWPHEDHSLSCFFQVLSWFILFTVLLKSCLAQATYQVSISCSCSLTFWSAAAFHFYCYIDIVTMGNSPSCFNNASMDKRQKGLTQF